MTVNRVLSLLDVFNMERRVLTVAELAELTSLPRSSVYRFVRILKENGLLMEHSPGRYTLGYKFLEYANIVRSDINITEIARPLMKELTFEFSETTILSVLSGVNAVCLATSTPNQPIKVSSEEGKIMPLYCGASSKSILAFQEPGLLDQIIEGGFIKRFTDQTLTDKEEIVENLKLVRDRGYAYSDSEIDEGIVSYGFPIKNSEGDIFASLSIVGTDYRMAKKNESELISRFKETVADIEKFL